MRWFVCASWCCFAILLASAVVAADPPAQTPIPGLGPVGPVKQLHTGFQFTEGPAADAAGNVCFTDIPPSKILRVDTEGRLSVFREQSNHTNGLMFTGSGELIGCEMEGRVVAMDAAGKVTRVIAAEFEGRRFNAPNDLVVDRAGGVYFTDPHFRAPQPLPQGVTAVYYAAADGRVSRLVSDLSAPNGVILSPDEQTLYVVPSLQAEMMAYPVLGPGRLGPGRVFCTLAQPEGQSGRGGDGLTVDVRGNLYITSALGLQVFSPEGAALGIIRLPEQPANVTFGGPDRKTLYVTARTSLYTVPMEVAGHAFGGK